MVPDPSPATTVDTPTDDSSRTVLNAVIGAVAGIILSFIPLSTLLGGVIAGYLEGGEMENGVKVGAIAGLIMLIPLVFIGLFALTFFLGVGTGGPPFAVGLMAFFILVFGALYTVGLSVVGGVLGIYLKNEL